MTSQAFTTDLGLQVPAITTDQMREVDRVAIEELGPNLYQMMENAGRSLAVTILETLGAAWSQTPITVLCGTGGNGGGGICAARHLANRGADVTVVVTDPGGLTPVPSEQLAIYRATSGRMAEASALHLLRPGLIVDAVIGYSLHGPPRGVARKTIDWAGAQSAPVISLDVPSGIDATTGESSGSQVRASVTLTLALPKTGLDAETSGDLWLADLGIPEEVYRRVGIDVPTGLFGDRFRLPLRPFGV
ncbi:MAG: NAD(P)H-hydrate epimerase [Myxococcales bacterium]|nr:NAD(P)H-hydrate epimerase [Myxococcales bacterium]